MCLAIPDPAVIQLPGAGGGELALLPGGEERTFGVWCFGSLQSNSRFPKIPKFCGSSTGPSPMTGLGAL